MARQLFLKAVTYPSEKSTCPFFSLSIFAFSCIPEAKNSFTIYRFKKHVKNPNTISLQPECRPQPPDPEGTCPVGSPRSDKPTDPPLLRGLEGGIQARSIEDVTRMIALI